MTNMKRFFKLFLAAALLIPAISISCTSEDDGGGSGGGGENAVNEWIYEKMESWYLWYDEMDNNPNYSLEYKPFFQSLLSDKDGKSSTGGRSYYSYIDRVSKGTRAGGIFELTHGLTIRVIPYNNSPVVDLLVLYVMPGSPAANAGIQRGDRIFNVGGEDLSTSNYRQQYPKLLSEAYGVTPQATTVKWYRGSSKTPQGPATLNPARMENNPVYICKKIGSTGYLLYDSFETGGDGHPYDDYLKRSIRNELSGITDLVVDLRYNGGGYVSSCRLLASIIAPADRAGGKFMTRKYNDKHSDQTDNFLSITDMQSGSFGPSESGVNLGLNRVYVLTTNASASASECLIHCLRGTNVEVIQIGTNTHGKNVGMSGFKSKGEKDFGNYEYEMWPVTFRIYNAKDESYTVDGFTPNHSADELSNDDNTLKDLGQLGDPTEEYLAAALHHIATGSWNGVRSDTGTRTGAETIEVLDIPILDRGIRHIED